jgi:hypothetical protein
MLRLSNYKIFLCCLSLFSLAHNATAQIESDTVRYSQVEPRDYFQQYIGYLYIGWGGTMYESSYSSLDYYHNDFRGNYDFSGQIELESPLLLTGLELAVGPFGERNVSFYPLGVSLYRSSNFKKNRVSSGLAFSLPVVGKKGKKQFPRFWAEFGFDLSYYFYKIRLHEQIVREGDPVFQSFDPYFHEDTLLNNNGVYELDALSGHLSFEPFLAINLRLNNFVSLRIVAKSSFLLHEEQLRLKMDFKPRWGLESEMEVGDFFIEPTDDNFSSNGSVVDRYPLTMLPLNINCGLVFRLKSNLGKAGSEFPRYRPN